jgi:hypothetical protein
MADLRIRVELNKGRVGIPLSKLANIAEETMKFLSMMCEDIGLGGDTKNWIASNFENKSVDFDLIKNDVVDEVKKGLGLRALRSVMRNDYTDSTLLDIIRPATRRQYANIASPIDSDEVVSFGLYNNGSAEATEVHRLDHSLAGRIIEHFPTSVIYFGEIQGIVHSFYKESDRPKIVVRELSTRNLVDCFFNSNQYEAVIALMESPSTVVFVEGRVTENMITGDVESIQAEDFRIAPTFDRAFFASKAGSFPGHTGKLSTEKAIDKFRGRGT